MRAAREQMYIGIRESEARNLVQQALSAAGLQNPFAITLFGRMFSSSFPYPNAWD